MIFRESIRMGDTVLLSSGARVVVESTYTRWGDRSGTYDIPGVTEARTFAHHPMSEVLAVVDRNPRRCISCGDGVTSTNADGVYCRTCFYRGVPSEVAHGALLGALRALPNVSEAYIEHTGGGCFCLLIALVDGRLVTCTEYDAVIPAPGDPWGVVVIQTEAQWNGDEEYSDDPWSLVTEVDEEMLSDAALVARIAAIPSEVAA